MENNDRLILVDAYSQIYRSFHAIPRLTNSHGDPTNCIYGVASFLLRIEETLPHKFGAVAFDKGAPAERLELLPEYKATRPPMPDDMQQQLDGVQAWIEAAGWPILQAEGHEADDLIAAVVKQTQKETYIISSDKDLAQLVTENVRLMMPGTKGRLNEVGAKEVEDKWGIPPNAICDFLALVGDSSDNIDGVPGVGAKTAADLLQQFGSIDNAFRHLDQINGKKLSKKLAEHRELVRRNQQVIKLNPTLPDDCCDDLSSLERNTPDWEKLKKFSEYYNFKSLSKRLDKLKENSQNPSLL